MSLIADSGALYAVYDADDAHHAVPDLQRADTLATPFDLAGELQARYVVRHAGRGGIQAAPLKQIGAVDSGGTDADNDVLRPGQRVRNFPQLQHFRPAEACDDDRSHRRQDATTGAKL